MKPANEWAEEFASREPYATRAAYLVALTAIIASAQADARRDEEAKTAALLSLIPEVG